MGLKEDLDLVKKYQKEIILLGKGSALLGWDQQTYMPKKGAETRAEQLALLNSIIHEKVISEELFKAVSNLRRKKLEGDDKLMVDRLYIDIVKSRKLPTEFVEELSKITTIAFQVWQEAKKKGEFKSFQPYLEKIIELKKKESEYIGIAGHPYNSLLDDFEEGMTAENLKPKFDELKKGLIAILKKIKDSKKYKELKFTPKEKDFPKELQMELVHDVSARIGLGKEVSRIDISEHPFTIHIGTEDVRITTAIRGGPFFSFGSTIHEAGHALYELGLPKEHAYDALGNSPSFGLHESQSRFWENMIGKGKPFWKFYYKQFVKKYGIKYSFDEWYSIVNLVHPGLIRIESDEVHYCLHVILRFEIELGLIEGSIQVKDLPKVWNEKIKEVFGVSPKNDGEGVLQDVHWSGGALGYFPTYALGSIYATQLYQQMTKDLKYIEKDIEKGDYSRIREWLKKKVYRHGRKMLADDIVKNICGEGLNPDVYLEYLDKKYGEIYGF